MEQEKHYSEMTQQELGNLIPKLKEIREKYDHVEIGFCMKQRSRINFSKGNYASRCFSKNLQGTEETETNSEPVMFFQSVKFWGSVNGWNLGTYTYPFKTNSTEEILKHAEDFCKIMLRSAEHNEIFYS